MTVSGRFENVLSHMQNAAGLVVDLRGNGGGSPDLALELVGHFMGTQTLMGHSCDEEGVEDLDFYCISWWAYPKGTRYAGPVAVLIDDDVWSAAELLAYGLCTVGDARCFGSTTAGETDSVLFDEIPGAVVATAVSEFVPAVGPSIQGVGIEPDERIGLRLEDLRGQALEQAK